MPRTLPESPIAPYKLAHVVIRTAHLEESAEYYMQLLNARIVVDQRPFALGLTFDEEHHRLALISVPEPNPAGPAEERGVVGGFVQNSQGADLADVAFSVAPGLEHIAFTFDSLGSLLGTYVRLREAGIAPAFCINHGPTVSMYYEDPDGNKTELQIDTMTMEQADEFLHGEVARNNPIGWPFDPDVLVSQYVDDEPLSSLMRVGGLPSGQPV